MKAFSAWIVIGLVGCAQVPSAQKPSMVDGVTSVRPQEMAVVPMSKGSLIPQSDQPSSLVRGFFEERRVSRVGDTLTVVLNETTRASKDGGTKANRQATSSSNFGANFSNPSTSKQTAGGLNAGGNNGFDASGAATASNQFSGTITATVTEVLANGNLVIAGEKRIAVGAEEEFIRFGGVVSPLNIKENRVNSSQVADLRLEYRGQGVTDEAQRPGWFTQLMMRYSPN